MKSTAYMHTIRWLLLPLLLALLAGCSSNTASEGGTSTSAESKTEAATDDTNAGEPATKKASEKKAPTLSLGYQDPVTGLVVKTPYGWEAVPYEGALVVLLSPSVGEEDIFRENVLIAYDDQFENLNMAAYLKALAYDLRQRYPDTNTVESGEIEIAGIMGHWLVDTFTGTKGPSKVYRVVLIKEQAAYVFHGTAPAATFDRYRPIFESIAQSMAWPKPEESK